MTIVLSNSIERDANHAKDASICWKCRCKEPGKRCFPSNYIIRSKEDPEPAVDLGAKYTDIRSIKE